ncbi:MAG TPA: NAD-dependent epimerase/dehydratase family protein [bacterium]|nr:NAD-dependent epimerase/dehydratase family protein [bacterium]
MKVLMTGGSGYFGKLLAGRLREEYGDDIDIVGVDVRECDMDEQECSDMRHVFGDSRKKRIEDVFKTEGSIDAVIHLAFGQSEEMSTDERMMTNVYGTFQMLGLAKKYGVRQFIYPSSTIVYGARQDNPALLRERHPLLGNRDIPSVRDRIEADMICQTQAQSSSGLRVVILRMVPIWRSSGESLLTMYMKGDYVPTLLGFDPMFQIIYEDEVLDAFIAALKCPTARGAYNIRGHIHLPLGEVIRRLGKKPVPLPDFLVHNNGRFIWSKKLSFDFNYIKYPFTVDGARAFEELGYDPAALKKSRAERNRPRDDGAAPDVSGTAAGS